MSRTGCEPIEDRRRLFGLAPVLQPTLVTVAKIRVKVITGVFATLFGPGCMIADEQVSCLHSIMG